uniref:RNase A-like domain-containing protein n=1 Tax=Aquibacillus kalidii TaxID=2762597 RepID=UPI002E29A057
FVEADGLKRSEMLGEVAIGLIGAKGLDKLAKAGKLGKFADKGTAAGKTISKTTYNLMPTRLRNIISQSYGKMIKGPMVATSQNFNNLINNMKNLTGSNSLAFSGIGFGARPFDRIDSRVEISKIDVKDSGGGTGKGPDNVKQGDKSSIAPGGGLAAHELQGGHLLERHVGKTDAELLERIRNNPRINGSSTFTERATAERVASEVLNDLDNKKAIESWLNNPQSKSNLVLTYEGTDTIGRGVKRGSTTVENKTNARIVLKKDGKGNYILTGYPN